ncbi:YkoF-like protein [Xylaria cubensis]|nr:YkoF-like protein [Xylaria cubensis]
MEYTQIATPERCYADFCLIPVGTGSVSVAAEVAEVQKLLKASGLVYTMHSAGTTVGTLKSYPVLPPYADHPPSKRNIRLFVIGHEQFNNDSADKIDFNVIIEGSWDEVMKVIGQAHSVVHARGVVRVQSSMRVGTRTDKKQTAQDKVKRVEDILSGSAS